MKSEFFNPNSKPSYALMSTISGHARLGHYQQRVTALLSYPPSAGNRLDHDLTEFSVFMYIN